MERCATLAWPKASRSKNVESLAQNVDSGWSAETGTLDVGKWREGRDKQDQRLPQPGEWPRVKQAEKKKRDRSEKTEGNAVLAR